ncbi:hypothetical protein J1N10_18060 [Carboxylicivirga sp. A043]|uniref:Uncharacterized protein n=1 Tax=Carboxylicivirga sediminis TaxID=2006564 RepID=A0A941EY57_9BACT|nr:MULTISPECIES: hypothetical protein [Carboxylicivirga]MBR8534051.1 hypothetical protein [Carboxylicivirga sediminis]MCU4157884.1 hypothetical protein [Carboxylicivirga sp. A043]
MSEASLNGSGKVGFLGGTLISVLNGITFEGVVETVFYTILGTMVSFGVSWLLKYFLKNHSKKDS